MVAAESVLNNIQQNTFVPGSSDESEDLSSMALVVFLGKGSFIAFPKVPVLQTLLLCRVIDCWSKGH